MLARDMSPLRRRPSLMNTPNRARRGFSLKPLLWQVILPHFRKNSKRLSLAFLGSACEQWINGEVFQAIIAARRDWWVRPEKSKRDLVLYESIEAERDDDPAAIIEAKVLYSPESPGVQLAKLATLRRQLEFAAHNRDCSVGGLVVYFDYQYRTEGDRTWYPTFEHRDWRLPGKAELKQLGLRNKFGSTHARIHLWGKQACRRVRMGEYTYQFKVALEVVEPC